MICWPDETDAFQFQDPLNLECHAHWTIPHILELTLDVLQRDRGPDRVVVENDLDILPPAPGEIAFLARPADLEVAPCSKRTAAIEPEAQIAA